MLLLPDRGFGLQLVDEKPGGLERIDPMGRAHDDRHRGISDVNPADPVLDGHPDERPSRPSLRHELADLGLNHFQVCLVYEVSDPGLAGRVVPDRPQE